MNTQDSQKKRVHQAVVRMLARRDHFAKEMKRKLLQKGFSVKEADEGVCWAQAKGWIQEEALAKGLVAAKRRRGYGNKVISAKLREKGVEGLEHTPSLWEEEKRVLLQWVERRYDLQELQDLAGRQKMFARLYRRGFSAEIIKECMRMLGVQGCEWE